MLKKLILKIWKSFLYAELPIDPVTVLIGTNASGKSNVIDALGFLNRMALGQDIEASLVGDRILPQIPSISGQFSPLSVLTQLAPSPMR